MSLRPKAKVHIRRNRFKVGAEWEDNRKRKDSVDIRKKHIAERPQKKLRQDSDALVGVDTVEEMFENLPSMVAGVLSEDKDSQLEATTQIRKLLSIEVDTRSPIQEVIDVGVVSRLVEFLKREDFPQLQFEASWALTNIASGTSDHTKVVIDNGALPIFVKLLSSPNDDVQEQAVWALGNISGDSTKCRDIVLGHGVVYPLLSQLNEDAKPSLLGIGAWTILNLCRGKPPPPFEQVKPSLPVLQKMMNSSDEEVMLDACWALSYISDGDDDQIEDVIDSDAVERVIEFLVHPSPEVVLPALRTVANVVTGDDAQTQYIIESDVLPIIRNFLTNDFSKSIKKEACWCVSNVLAGTEEQIQEVLDADLIGPLVDMLQNAEFDIRKEAGIAISNAVSGGIEKQIKYVADQGCIKPLCDLLVCKDPKLIEAVVEALDNILTVGKTEMELGYNGGVNVYAQMIEDCEGLQKIEKLQNHENDDIYEKVVSFLESYWSEAEDEEDKSPSADEEE